jgi:hypothetical protein
LSTSSLTKEIIYFTKKQSFPSHIRACLKLAF